VDAFFNDNVTVILLFADFLHAIGAWLRFRPSPPLPPLVPLTYTLSGSTRLCLGIGFVWVWVSAIVSPGEKLKNQNIDEERILFSLVSKCGLGVVVPLYLHVIIERGEILDLRWNS
jgi:hypothetical protein